jgi:hypothetical protein
MPVNLALQRRERLRRMRGLLFGVSASLNGEAQALIAVRERSGSGMSRARFQGLVSVA